MSYRVTLVFAAFHFCKQDNSSGGRCCSELFLLASGKGREGQNKIVVTWNTGDNTGDNSISAKRKALQCPAGEFSLMSFYFSRSYRSFPIIIWAGWKYSLPSSQPAVQETQPTIISLGGGGDGGWWTLHCICHYKLRLQKSRWLMLCLHVRNALWTASSISL